MATEPPYPTASTTEYRLSEVERRLTQVERESNAATLAVMKSDIANLRSDMNDVKNAQKETQHFIALSKGENQQVKKLLTWVLAAVAVLGVALPYLIGVPGAG